MVLLPTYTDTRINSSCKMGKLWEFLRQLIRFFSLFSIVSPSQSNPDRRRAPLSRTSRTYHTGRALISRASRSYDHAQEEKANKVLRIASCDCSHSSSQTFRRYCDTALIDRHQHLTSTSHDDVIHNPHQRRRQQHHSPAMTAICSFIDNQQRCTCDTHVCIKILS